MFRMPVRLYMTREPDTVREDATLEEVAGLLERRRISAMPVVDDDHCPVGVISRRDLLRVGELSVPEGRAVPEWTLPDETARDVMSRQLVVVAPSTSIAEAASHLLDNHIHRLFVEVERELRGVLTTRDVMKAIVDARLEAPISRFMSKPLQTIATFEPLQVARRQLEELKVRGLVVAEEGIPVGLFTEEDALAARHQSADVSVERVMGHAFLVLRPETPTHQAAARMASMHVRRIVVMADGELQGILTGFDLAGAAAVS
ncbi:MAG TPA: CBS domain-containing protein [Sandaracinaceae bacterium LLY-WYZ-13_1]|nr:CBS domain-containing protein [Sandaracinaceae bacterium LLY-WYZ-13_1]